MAKQKRKPAAEPTPVTKHPLFPAVVALWFAALFGLGSLAIRPGLIESLVLATHIDTIVPAAAPPLGVTARICIALAMAVFGGLIGAKFVQFINRPRPDAHQRKRGAATINEAGVRRRDAHPDAPARMPISAHEEFGIEAIEADAGPGAIPGRRRALTAEDQEAVFTIPEFAPLPGGEPQVIDLGELDLAGSEVREFEPLPRTYAAEPAPAHQHFATPAGEAEGRQVFGHPVPQDQPFAAPLARAADPEAAAPAIANYGAPVAPPIDFTRPHEVVSAANAARTEEAPLFGRPAAAPAPIETPQVEPVTESAPLAPITAEAVAEAAAVALDSLGLVELTERFAATLRKRRAALAASAAAVDAMPVFEPVTAPAEPVAELAEAVASTEPAEFSLPPFAVPSFLVPEAAGSAPSEPAVAADPVPVTPLQAAPAPVSSFEPAAPVFAPLGGGTAEPAAVEPAIPAAPLAMPAALRPISFDDLDEDEDFATYLPLRHIPMPQAAASVPPAVEPAPAPMDFAPAPQPVEASAPQTFVPPEPEVVEEQVANGYSSLLEMSKPVVQARQEFVRIDEPEIENAAIEPVVIFPGQAARQGLGQAAPFAQPSPFAQPAPIADPVAVPGPVAAEVLAEAASLSTEVASLRRFDAPGNAAAGQPVAAPAAAQMQDPAETERALRAALATLQRMSGAA